MKRSTQFTLKLRTAFKGISEALAHKWKNNFYLYLALLFSVLVVFDSLVIHYTANLRQATFDTIVRHRLIVPPADPDIVIVDINEASLAAMGQEYGRWPWPRQVLGEFLEKIEAQRPQAVVFDVLFSDPDVYNPDSDAYFDAAVAATTNTFFPMLRLDPSNDALSEIRPDMIPGVTPLGDQAAKDATLAMILPPFASIMQGGRLGLHNIDPDPDGVVRKYAVYRDDYGWKIPSLPLRTVQALGYPAPPAREVLLNWRGKPFTYHYVSFSDVYFDMLSQDKQRPADEFTGKIVLIGSTAPSLFDIKPTPLAKLYPGVEILATAIDNFKHGDYLRFPEGRLVYFLITMAILWATAWGFYRNLGREKIDRLFGASQLILLAITYASINLTTTYINLTGPVTIGLAYFTLARLYAYVTGKALEMSAVRVSQRGQSEQRAVLMLIELPESIALLGEKTKEKIRKELAQSGAPSKSVERLAGEQKGIWSLFENHLVVTWLAADAAAQAQVRQDVEVVTEALRKLLRDYDAAADNEPCWWVREGTIAGGAAAGAHWRALLAEAQLEWEQRRIS